MLKSVAKQYQKNIITGLGEKKDTNFFSPLSFFLIMTSTAKKITFDAERFLPIFSDDASKLKKIYNHEKPQSLSVDAEDNIFGFSPCILDNKILRLTGTENDEHPGKKLTGTFTTMGQIDGAFRINVKMYMLFMASVVNHTDDREEEKKKGSERTTMSDFMNFLTNLDAYLSLFPDDKSLGNFIGKSSLVAFNIHRFVSDLSDLGLLGPGESKISFHFGRSVYSLLNNQYLEPSISETLKDASFKLHVNQLELEIVVEMIYFSVSVFRLLIKHGVNSFDGGSGQNLKEIVGELNQSSPNKQMSYTQKAFCVLMFSQYASLYNAKRVLITKDDAKTLCDNIGLGDIFKNNTQINKAELNTLKILSACMESQCRSVTK